MAVELPCTAMGIRPDQHGIVAEDQLPRLHLDHAKLIDSHEAPFPVFFGLKQIVVAENEPFFPVQPREHAADGVYAVLIGKHMETEVPQMPDNGIARDNGVPVANQCFIHLFDVLEGSVAERDDICMPEMGVCRKKYWSFFHWMYPDLLLMLRHGKSLFSMISLLRECFFVGFPGCISCLPIVVPFLFLQWPWIKARCHGVDFLV